MSDIVSVGQVWTNGSYSFKITEIVSHPDGCDVFAYDMSDVKRQPILFGNLSCDGKRNGWADWRLAEGGMVMTTFGKLMQSRVCPCGIFRGDCDYHRG